MKLHDKLAEWEKAGLIDGATRTRIAAHEARPTRSYLLYAVGGLGALSVAIGLVSIVAANWAEIPGRLKLALDLALLAGLGAGVYRSEAKTWPREILIFLFYGAVLASIGLVGQVYHLGGKLENALLLWSLITAPVVLHGNGRFLGAVWLVGLETALLMQLARWDHPPDVVLLASGYLVCLALVAVGVSRRCQRAKPEFSSVARTLGVVEVLAIATLAPLRWYSGSSSADARNPGLGLTCLLGVAAASAALAVREQARRERRPGAAIAVATTAAIASFVPFLVEHRDSGPAAAASFLLVWALVGFTAYQRKAFGILNLATALLGIRLLIIYFEVFGSLLGTGIGLVSGGALTLFLAWLWVRNARRWGRVPGTTDDLEGHP